MLYNRLLQKTLPRRSSSPIYCPEDLLALQTSCSLGLGPENKRGVMNFGSSLFCVHQTPHLSGNQENELNSLPDSRQQWKRKPISPTIRPLQHLIFLCVIVSAMGKDQASSFHRIPDRKLPDSLPGRPLEEVLSYMSILVAVVAKFCSYGADYDCGKPYSSEFARTWSCRRQKFVFANGQSEVLGTTIIPFPSSPPCNTSVNCRGSSFRRTGAGWGAVQLPDVL